MDRPIGMFDSGFGGLTVARAVIDLLPDCELAVDAFCAISSQWRVGPGGATGLDNTAIRPTLRMAGIKVAPDRWPQLFADLRTLEGEALRTMHESKP